MESTTSEAAAAPAASWKRTVGTIAAVLLGAIILYAVYGKSIDPAAFTEQIAHEGLDFALPANAMMFVALGIEAILGVLLLLNVRRLWVLIPVTLLVLFFLFLTGRTWYMDAHGLAMPLAGCGCFGNLLERTPEEAFWMDLVSLLPLAILAWLGRPKGPPHPLNRLGLAGAATVVILVFAWMAPKLQLDDLATKLGVGTEVAEVCAGRGDDRACLSGEAGIMPDWMEGQHLVVLSELHEQQFLDAIPRLNEQAAQGEPRLWIVTSQEKDDHFHLEFDFQATFTPEVVPPSLLRPLYRSLPRSFLVENGTVTKTWSGLPPLPNGGP